MHRYAHSASKGQLAPCLSASQRLWPRGLGYCLLQLAWAGEAYVVGEDGTPLPLPAPALDHLRAQGAHWLLSRRVRDLSLLAPAAPGVGALDPGLLGTLLATLAAQGAVAASEVGCGLEPGLARALDAEVWAVAAAAAPEGQGQGASSSFAYELRGHQTIISGFTHTLDGLRRAPGHVALTAMGRYLLHLPSLQGALGPGLQVGA